MLWENLIPRKFRASYPFLSYRELRGMYKDNWVHGAVVAWGLGTSDRYIVHMCLLPIFVYFQVMINYLSNSKQLMILLKKFLNTNFKKSTANSPINNCSNFHLGDNSRK
jgi:hypothetical protein